MNELIQLEMTPDEARETDRLIKRHINTTRYLLLDMRDRKGWKALGYESFGDYGKQSLGYEKAYLTQLADAGEISIQLGYDSEFAIANRVPPEGQLRPLKSVPEDERKAIWDEAMRKAEEEGAKLTAKRVEDAVAEWKQRSQDWHHQYITERDHRRQAEIELHAAHQRQPEPVTITVTPPDYEAFKQRAKELTDELAQVRAEQTRIIQSAIKAKLSGYQGEVDALERQKNQIEDIIARKKAYLDSLDSDVKRIETHRGVIDGSRLELISLAAFLNDLDPMSDPDTIRRWLALADMHEEAAKGIRLVFGPAKPTLTVIHGDAA